MKRGLASSLAFVEMSSLSNIARYCQEEKVQKILSKKKYIDVSPENILEACQQIDLSLYCMYLLYHLYYTLSYNRWEAI